MVLAGLTGGLTPGEQAPHAAGTHWRILIVDDEPDILESLAALIDGLMPAAKAIPAGTPGKALQHLRAGGIDAVVADYRMHGLDGVEFLRQARLIEPDVPRMLLTAYPDLKVALAALHDGGISAFLAKPVQPETFLATLADLVSTRDATDRTPSPRG